MVHVRSVATYYGSTGDKASGSKEFCGACGVDIGGVYGHNYAGFIHTIDEALEANDAEVQAQREREQRAGFEERRANGTLFQYNAKDYWRERDEKRETFRYYAFCPWCGVAFDDEWWRNKVIENERATDHFRNPGWHKGDSHEFHGEGPDCMEGHWLGVSGGDKLCWCDPGVEPSLLGCTILHRAITYTQYQAERALIVETHGGDVDTWDENYKRPKSIKQFEKRYASRSGVSVDWLHAHGRFGAKCDCGDEICEGFQMTHRDEITPLLGE